MWLLHWIGRHWAIWARFPYRESRPRIGSAESSARVSRAPIRCPPRRTRSLPFTSNACCSTRREHASQEPRAAPTCAWPPTHALALRLSRPFVTGPLADKANAGLRRLGRALGDVRDMDVALARLESTQGSLPSTDDLALLTSTWRARRHAARRTMLRYLDSQSYRSFQVDYRRLQDRLRDAFPRRPVEDTVISIAPRFIHIRWRIVRAYQAVIAAHPSNSCICCASTASDSATHSSSSVRFYLTQWSASIPEVVAMQDHLGEMHDAAVAVEMIDDFST